MNKSLIPGPPPSTVFAAPTHISVDGWPPADMLVKVRVRGWPGRLLIASGGRIEDLEECASGRWGAVAAVVPRIDGLNGRHFVIGHGDLRQEIPRVLGELAASAADGNHGLESREYSALWAQEVEVVAILLPKNRGTAQIAEAVAEWLTAYLEESESKVEFRQSMGSIREQDRGWVANYLASLGMILLLRDHVTQLTKHLPDPWIGERREAR